MVQLKPPNTLNNIEQAVEMKIQETSQVYYEQKDT